jgi:hypothetical protein
MVFSGEAWRQEPNRGQRDRGLLEQVENHRILSRRARRLDAVVGRTFGQMQRAGTVAEHRRISFAEIQPPAVDLHERAQQCRDRVAFRSGETLCGVE